MAGALRPSLSHDIVKEEPTDGMLPVAILDLHEEVTDEQISDALSGLKNVRQFYSLDAPNGKFLVLTNLSSKT